MMDGKKADAAAADHATDHLTTDDLPAAVEAQSPPDDSLIGIVVCDADIPFAQIDATLDLLASTPDIADLPALDWDLPG